MERLDAPDGTTIAYERTGTGPPLVLVMGALCDRLSTATLSPLLAPDFTVYEYDRRGRGDSTEVGEYSVQREVDDLAAVLTVAADPAFVFGHSSGGCLALEAAASGVAMAGLAVYEPPYTAADDGSGGPAEMLDAIQQLLRTGDRDGAVAAFVRGTGAPAERVEAMRNEPFWPRMAQLAPTLPYDLILADGGRVPGERLSRITVDTVAVSGGNSPTWAARSCAAIAAAVPHARHEVLEGQTHAPADDVLAPWLRAHFLT
ncbi:MAG: alpha/beta fold hydrolase [Blastococcus sp.]